MKCVLVFATCLLAVSAHPGGLYAGYAVAPVAAASVSSQYHAQDELGQYSYGYSGGPSAKQETRTADGITRGGYSYVDANGLVQSTSYVSDPINGFRVAATNLPVAPAAPVVAAPVAVAPVAVAASVPVVTEARLVDPVAIAAGAPLPTGDTVEVAAAKAAHFQAHADATVRNHGVVSYAAPTPLAYSGFAHASPLAYASYAHATPVAYAGYAHAAPLAYAAPIALASEARQIDPVAIAAGAPLPTGDTIEVAAAKAAHFQAHAVATAGHLRYKRGLAYAAAPLAYAAYAPRSFGYSAVTAHASPLAYGYAHAAPLAYTAPIALASEARQIDPVAIAAGAPLPTGDTIEVAAAKAAHLQAHAAATVRNHGVLSYAQAAPLAYTGYSHASPLAYTGYAHAAPLAYAAPIALASEARQIDPVAIAAGAPLPTGDTVEVAAAKAAHLHAHASETARHLGAIVY